MICPPDELGQKCRKAIEEEKMKNAYPNEDNSGKLFLTPEKDPRSSNGLSGADMCCLLSSEVTGEQSYSLPSLWNRARSMKKKVGIRKVSMDKIFPKDLSVVPDSLSTPVALNASFKRESDMPTLDTLQKANGNLLNTYCQLYLHSSMPKSDKRVKNKHNLLKHVQRRRRKREDRVCPSFSTCDIPALLQDNAYQPKVILVNCCKEYGKSNPEYSKPLAMKQLFRRKKSCSDVSTPNNLPLFPGKIHQPHVMLFDCIKKNCVKSESEFVKSQRKKPHFKGQTSSHKLGVSYKQDLPRDVLLQPHVCLVDCSKENYFNVKPLDTAPSERKQLIRSSGSNLRIQEDQAYQPYVYLVDFIKENNFDINLPSEEEQAIGIPCASSSTQDDEAVPLNKTYQPNVCLDNCKKEQTLDIDFLEIKSNAQDSWLSYKSGDHEKELNGISYNLFQTDSDCESIASKDYKADAIKEKFMYNGSMENFENYEYDNINSSSYQDEFLSFLSSPRLKTDGSFE